METEKIVFEVDASSYIEQLVQISRRIEGLKQKQAELRAAAKTGDAEAAKSLERVNLQLENQEKAYAQAQKAASTFAGAQKQGVDVTNFANNSIKVNRELLAQLKTGYEKTAKPSAELQKNIATLTGVLGEQEKGMTKSTEKVSVLQEVYARVIDYLKNAPGPLGAAARAFDGVGKAIAAGTGPVGIIIEVLKGLWDILQSNSDTAAEIRNIMAGLGNVFGKVATDVVNFGKKFIEVLSEPKKLINEVGDLIRENITNRFKAFGVIITAIQNKDLKGLANGFLQLGTGVTNVTGKIGNLANGIKQYATETVGTFTQAYVASKQMVAVEVTMAKLNSTIKRNERDIVSLTKKLKDKSLTEQQAADIANSIANKEIENLQKIAQLKQIELEEQRKRYMQNKHDAKEQAALIEKQTEADIAAQNVKAALQDKEATMVALLSDRKQQLLEDEREQRRVNIELMADGLEKEKALLNLAFEQEAEQLRKHNVSETAIKELHKQRLQELTDKHEKETAEAQQKALDDKLQKDIEAAEKEETNEESKQRRILTLRIKYAEEQLKIAEDVLKAEEVLTDAQVANIEKLRKALSDLKAKFEEVKETTTKKGETSTAKALGISEESLAEAEEYLSRIQTAFQQVSQTVQMAFETRLQNIETTKNAEISAIEESTLSEKEKAKKKKEIEQKAAKDKYDIELKQFKANKAISIVQTTISTAQAVMSAFTAPWPASIVFAALAAAAGIAQIAIIASQKPPAPPKFAKGIIGLPGPGTETSDSIPAYLSKGESVITAKATKRFAPVLAQMEMAVGNLPNYNYTGGHFATGVIGDGGFYTRESVNSVQNTTTLRDAIAQGFREAPQPVVSVQEITRVNNNVSRSVKVSEL